MVQEIPQSLEVPLCLHQAYGKERRRRARALVQETPQSLEVPLCLHQAYGEKRRRRARALVQETPQSLEVPLCLHQVYGEKRRRRARALVQEIPQRLEVPLCLHQVYGEKRRREGHSLHRTRMGKEKDLLPNSPFGSKSLCLFFHPYFLYFNYSRVRSSQSGAQELILGHSDMKLST